MDVIKETVQKSKPSLSELINCFECIKDNGDVAVIKFDGERVDNGYTVLILFSSSKNRDLLRADEQTLEDALLKVLKKYIE